MAKPIALAADHGGFELKEAVKAHLDEGAIVAAEWSENFADLLALEHPIRVNIDRVDENTRRITIEGVTL